MGINIRKTSLKTVGENLHTDLSKERERGREEKSKSSDLSNRSLKTDGETECEEPT